MKFEDAKILVTVLDYPFVESECFVSLVGMWEYSKWICPGKNYPRNDVEMFFTNATSPARAHNKAIRTFLEEPRGYKSLLIVGRDHIFRPDALQRLYEADKDVIAGITTVRLKSYNELKKPIYSVVSSRREDGVCHTLTKFECLQKIEEKKWEPWEVPVIGSGIMLIKRKVLERMSQPWVYEPPQPKDEIPEGRPRGTVGCDIVFCERAKELGFKIWAHPGVQYVHIGRSYTSVAY